METMEILEVQDFSFSYPGKEKPMLERIQFSLKQGEVALLCGNSGSGKSTLIQNLKPLMARRGEKSGNIYFQGKDVFTLSLEEQTKIGYVGQDTEHQIVTDKVWHELAFGLENLGLSNGEIRLRVAEIASYFGIEQWYHKKVQELSGGQKQLLNLASVMVMRPELLLLDEPCSKLDPIATSNFMQTLMKLNRDFGITILIAEHNLEEIYSLADEVLFLQKGHLYQNKPREMALYLSQQGFDMIDALPSAYRIQAGLSESRNILVEDAALTVKEGRTFLEAYCKEHPPVSNIPKEKESTGASGKDAISFEHVYFRYETAQKDLLSDLSITVRKGEIYALLGGNGAGKSTCISLMSGIEQPYMGNVKIEGKRIDTYQKGTLYRNLLGVVPQNPQELFSKETVQEELEEICELQKEATLENMQHIISEMELENNLTKHPYDLSGGEQQRLAIAKILLLHPQILILDEPTKGMDAHYKKKFGEFLLQFKRQGGTIFLVSHDIEFCAQYSDSCGMLFDGTLIAQAPPVTFFQETYWYTSATVRMTRNLVENVVTVPQVLEVFLKKDKDSVESFEKTEGPTKRPKDQIKKTEDSFAKKRKVVWKGRSLLLLLGIIFLGGHFFGEKMNYLACLCVLVLSFVPFFVRFEKQAHTGYQLILVSVLSAIGVIGRVAFYMVPQFKPVAAICMIAGAGLGAEAGFMTGVLTAFVSNFFFGQGPWTVFQMVAFGIVGAIGGFCRKAKGWILCICGFFATFVIYGLIMNFSSALLAAGNQTELISGGFLKSYISYIASGIPMDLIHGISTVFFLAIGAKPILKKINRIKRLYEI